jgi:hypothetical protein
MYGDSNPKRLIYYVTRQREFNRAEVNSRHK